MDAWVWDEALVAARWLLPSPGQTLIKALCIINQSWTITMPLSVVADVHCNVMSLPNGLSNKKAFCPNVAVCQHTNNWYSKQV